MTLLHSFMRSTAYLVKSFSWLRTLSIPNASRYFTASAKPTAPQMLGVPASNFQGKSFQLMLQLPCPIKLDFLNHFSSALERRHFFKQFFFAVKHSDACWTKHLMS